MVSLLRKRVPHFFQRVGSQVPECKQKPAKFSQHRVSTQPSKTIEGHFQGDTKEDFKSLLLEIDRRGYLYELEHSEVDLKCIHLHPLGEDEDPSHLRRKWTSGVCACIVKLFFMIFVIKTLKSYRLWSVFLVSEFHRTQAVSAVHFGSCWFSSFFLLFLRHNLSFSLARKCQLQK